MRSTGLVNEITQQPLKGRKKGGGVRFGEMEKDALVAHGCSFMMQERMLHASDGTMVGGCCVRLEWCSFGFYNYFINVTMGLFEFNLK